MPRTNIDYSNTSIYKLCCKDINITEIYIGHTTCMRRRKCSHKSRCNNEKNKDYNFNVYQFIRANGGFDNWDMIEIERYNAVDGYDATKRERYWIEELKANLNMVIPTRTEKEYYESNKEIIKKNSKKYYENNKEHCIEINKKYNENNKEKIKEYLKKYHENNKEHLKQLYSEKRKEKIACECGCVVCKYNLHRHIQSKKHNDLIQLVCYETSNVRVLC